MASILDADHQDVRDVVPVDFARLGHVYVFANGKGGVGKTTTAANIAGLAASDGARTLLVDLNGQGNVGLNLGFQDEEGMDDRGRGLYRAVCTGDPLEPIRDVRPNLDVVPGGPMVRRITRTLEPEAGRSPSPDNVLFSLARSLEEVADDYKLIVIDSPPENPFLMRLALVASRWVLAPMNSDRASQTGLRELAVEFTAVKGDPDSPETQFNPYIQLLGVFLFDSGSRSTLIHKQFRNDVKDLLGDAAQVFTTVIRSAETVAVQSRKYGKLAFELEDEVKNNPREVSATSIGLAQDYANLAAEAFKEAAARQRQMKTEGVWP